MTTSNLRHGVRRLLGVAAAMAMVLVAAPSARAQAYTSTGPISIPANGVASTYPSTINVAGGPASMTSGAITVVLNGLTTNDIDDLDFLLVAPNGDEVMLLSDMRPGTTVFTGSLRFGSAGVFPLVTQVFASGATYAPVNYDTTTDALPAPAPVGPFGSSFSDFSGDNANGLWRLFIFDDLASGGAHTLSSWSIIFGTPVSTTNTGAWTYQGRLKVNGSASGGTADLRLSLWTSATDTSLVNRVAGPVDIAAVPIASDGSFTVGVPFDAGAYQNSSLLFLDVAVRTPAGSGSFTSLSPRQALNATPLAISARQILSPGSALTPALEATGGGDVRIAGNLTLSGGSLFFNSGGNITMNLIAGSTGTLTLQRTTRSIGTTNSTIAIVDEEGTIDAVRGMRVARLATGPALVVDDTSTVSLTETGGMFQVGFETGINLTMDGSVMQARSNATTAGTLNLNTLGGNVRMLPLTGGLVGIGRTPTANRLEVNGDASKAAAGQWLANSDARIKREVLPITGALATLARVRPVTFRYTETYVASHQGIDPARRYSNVLAQDFARVFPGSVKGSGEYLPGMEGVPAGEILQVDTHPALMTSIAAVNELHELVRRQQTQIERLAELNARLEARLRALEAAGAASSTQR